MEINLICNCQVCSCDPLLSTPVNHSQSTDDSTDEPVVTERGRKKTKSKKGGTKRRKRSDTTQSG